MDNPSPGNAKNPWLNSTWMGVYLYDWVCGDCSGDLDV